VRRPIRRDQVPRLVEDVHGEQDREEQDHGLAASVRFRRGRAAYDARVTGPVLIAIEYESPDAAGAALTALEELSDGGALRLVDAAVVTRSESGEVSVAQQRQLAVGEGVVAGGAIGLVVGLIVGGPVVGALAGMAGGAGWSARDTGLTDGQLERFGEHLGARGAALFALVRDPDWPRVTARLEGYGGELLVSEVSPAVAAAFADTSG
jgi:uncharacterized membrane protein